MYGEHAPHVHLGKLAQGSSPHVRGAQNAIVLGDEVRGIIPACTGSTLPNTSQRAQGRDHPRMYGEHDSSLMA